MDVSLARNPGTRSFVGVGCRACARVLKVRWRARQDAPGCGQLVTEAARFKHVPRLTPVFATARAPAQAPATPVRCV